MGACHLDGVINPLAENRMKRILALLCLGLAVPMTQAQETNEVEQLKRQLQQMQENFERVQREQTASKSRR